MSSLATVKVKSMTLYISYRNGLITQEEYQTKVKPLDKEIDTLELECLIHYLEDNPAYQISSSKHLH